MRGDAIAGRAGHRPRLGVSGDVAIALGLAACAASALILWLGRGTTFSTDELDWFSATPNLDLHTALTPYNGHLILLPRIVYAAMFNVFGAHYLPFRILGLACVLATAVAFFIFAARRVGPVVALAPTVVLLVFGSDANHILLGNAFTDLMPLVFGIGALLALERDDRPGDVTACVMLCLAVACYSTGLAFVGGAAALTALEPARRRRAWVVVVPVLLYVAWLAWSRNDVASTGDNAHISNLLLAPIWAVDSIASVGTSLLGLNYPAFTTDWGPAVALAALGALGLRLRRGASSWLLATMAVPVTLWTLAATAAVPLVRVPSAARYMLPGAVCVLLVAAEAARGARLKRPALAVLAVATTFSLATNLKLLASGSTTLRAVATATRVDLAGVEIGDGRIGTTAPPPLILGPDPGANLWTVLGPTGSAGLANDYVEAVQKFGSPAFSLAELVRQPETVREHLDTVLANGFGPQLRPSASPPTACGSVAAEPGRPLSLRLPPGGAVLRVPRASAAVSLRRFGSAFTVPAGILVAGTPMSLTIPADAAPDPWYASVPAPSVSICSIRAVAAP